MTLRSIRIEVPGWVFGRRTEVMYMVLGPDGLPQQEKSIRPGSAGQLFAVVSKYTRAHIDGRGMPPEEIAPAILNIAEDVRAGRAPTLRAGEYIALQRFVRAGGR